MTLRKQDIGVLVFHYLGFSKLQKLILELQNKPITRIVTFHDLPSMNVDNFKENIEFLRLQTNVIDLEDYFLGKLSTKKINTIITFDDGYRGWIDYAIPILEKMNLPATFFITSGFLDLSEQEENKFIKKRLMIAKTQLTQITGGLRAEDVRIISDKGFCVGGHTLNHCNLSKTNDLTRIKYELNEDKKKLEDITGKEISYFAYPSGDYNNSNIDLRSILKETGYKGAVTVVPGNNHVETNPYLLHRELTRTSMSKRVFKARVTGNYDAVSFMKNFFSTILKK